MLFRSRVKQEESQHLPFPDEQPVRDELWDDHSKRKRDDSVTVKRQIYECLVREVIRMRIRSRDEAYRFLHGWTKPDGKWQPGWNEKHPGSTLEADVKAQWRAGNRGEKGEWK